MTKILGRRLLNLYMAAVTVGLICLGTAPPCAGATVTLFDEDGFGAAIVSNGNDEQAQELAEYLSQISGTAFTVVDSLDDVAEGRAAVVLSMTADIPGISNRPTGQQGYRIHSENGRLYLTGRTGQALTYAVYGFLDDHLGVRFYAPDVEKVPTLSALTIGPLDDRQEPAFLARSFSRPYGHPLARQEPLFREKNRGNTPRIVAHHNFYHWIPPGDYFKEHPEWFPMADGERRTHHTMPLCASNVDLARELARKFMAKMQEQENSEFAGYPLIFSAGQGDGFLRCDGPECRALAKREGTEAAPFITMLNRALEITAEKYPEHKVITYAYFGTLKAPATLRPHRNLWINIVSSALSPYPAGDQLGTIRDNPHNRDYRKAIEEWTELAPGRVAIWDWTGNFTDATMEWPNIFSVADNIRFFYEQNVDAVFLEQPGGEQNWGWMRKWIWARMMWNPQRDPRELMREFIFAYYGDKAGPFIWEYHNYVDRVARESRYASATVRWSAWPLIIRGKLFPDDRLHAMTALLHAALNAAAEEDPVYQARVRQALATSVDSLLLTDAGVPARVADPRDGRMWLVPGGQADFPERIERVADAWLKTTGSGAESWHFRYRFLQRTGGPLESLENDHFAVESLPAVRGQLSSLIHLPTGREILAPGNDLQIGGYTDRLPGATTTIGWQEDAYHRHWLGEATFRKSDDVLDMYGVPVTSPWHTPNGYIRRKERYQLHREVSLVPQDAALIVRRSYLGRRMRAEMQVFESAWSFAVPKPEDARITVREGDTEHTFMLGVLQNREGLAQADDRPIPFTDVMIQDFDFVDGKALTLEVQGDSGDIVILLDRGDGLTVELTTPAAGSRTVALTPALSEKRFTVVLGSESQQLPAEDTATIELPPQILRVNVNEATLHSDAVRTMLNPRDGAEMVWVPEGRFLMGTATGQGNPDESPQRRIYLDGYWIYKHPVTVAQYRLFCEATGRTMPKLPTGSDGDDHAVFNVNWHDAADYSSWAAAALPTEAQWEKAARGADGRTYPWGDGWDPDLSVNMENTYGDLRYGTRPVGMYAAGASPYGVMDMAGQVWEWVADWYAPDAYRSMIEFNPTGPARGDKKVLRGGSLNWSEWLSRSAYRNFNPPHIVGWIQTGFRCVVAEEDTAATAARKIMDRK